MKYTHDCHEHQARLELRILELEDTSRGIVSILATLNDMVGTLNRALETTAHTLHGLASALPRNAPSLPLWPTTATTTTPTSAPSSHAPQGCNGPCQSANNQ